MDGRKYPLHSSEVQKGRGDRAADMPSFWQACDLTRLETDSDTTSTLSSPTFGSSTNASYGGSSSNSSSDFDVWKFDWALKKKKREKREETTVRTVRKSDAIAETTDSSEELESTLLKNGPDVLYKRASKEVYLLTNRQTRENDASTHIGNNLEQINLATQGVDGEGVQVFQGDLTGTDHLDDPMHGVKVTSTGTDTTNQYARGRAFALVAAGRPNGQQRAQNVRGDHNSSGNVATNFFDANFPNGRVFVALGTKGEVTREINGATTAINEDLTSCEISVTGETSGGTTGRGHSGHGSAGRSARCGAGERVSARGESANRAEETVNTPAVSSPLPVITVTSDDEDRPQTNVIFSKDNNTSWDDLNRCNNIPSADSGLDIRLTRSFWTQSCDPLPEYSKEAEEINGWPEKAGSLPDVRAAVTREAVFSENFGSVRHHPRVTNSTDVLSQSSLNEFGLVSDLHSQKVGCEEGDTLSARFPGSKGSDTDTCQNSRSDIENTSGTVTGDRQHFSRTHSESEMVVSADPIPRHGLNGEERIDNNVRTEGHGMIREKRNKESGNVNHFGVEPMDKISPRRSVNGMEPRETAPLFRSETNIDIPAAKPLRRQDSLTKSTGIFFSSFDFVNKPAERSEAKTTGRATDLDTALRRNQEFGNFNLISTFPGDRLGARSRVTGQGSSNSPRHDQRKVRTPRSRSKSPNEVRVQEALRKLDLPGWYVNSDVAKVGVESPVLKRSRSADTTLSDSGVGTLPRQNQGEKMSSPTGEDPRPFPRKISPPSGQEPGPYRGRRQSREERLSEFYSQRKLHPYPNRRNSQDNRELQSPPVCNGAAAMGAEDSSPEQNRRSTRAPEPDSRESTPEHSPKAAGDHENERFNTTWSSSEMSIDLPSSEDRPESALPTLSPPLHRKTPPVITLSASPTRYAALTRSNPNLHEVGKPEDMNVTITITETPRLDAPFTGMEDLQNQSEDVSLEDMLDSLLAIGSRRSSKSGSQSPNEIRRLSEDRLENLVAETLPFDRRASDPVSAPSNNQLESTLMSTNTTYDFAEALDALNTTSSSVDTSVMNTTSSSMDTAVDVITSSPKSLTSPFQTTSSFFETASSAAPDTTSGSFSASELRDMMTDEMVTVRCSYAKCKRTADLKEAKQSYKSCHNCYTYYCSRDCRKNHWERHKRKCVFSQINSTCKHILQYSRTNEEVQKCFSRVARTGYLSRGRGCVMLSFSSLQDAQDFLNSGLPALPTLPGYKTFRELKSVQTEPKDPHTETLITMVTTYDPDVKMVVDVSIAVDTTNVKAHLVPRREGPNIRQCAKIRLSERHIVKKTREEQSDEPEAATMILTSPPGSPEKMQHISDRRSREICFINIQRNLRARGVILRHQYPDVYRKLCVYVEKNESFPPVTIYPRDTNTGKTFMCLIMPDSDPEILEWVQNPDLLEDIIA
ncbi:serine-rich adhesin for platelets-like [Branchiostoma lanceolatum]|uniref:serine-rich adhesin for platelets-like n=1 Tax=Branchiostoma lanceolatum TaxID=7740 RepID=UPI0034513698